VSLAPQNDAILEAACLTTTLDVITLDYTATNNGLPFKLRGSNVNDAMNSQIGLEILYGPCIVNTAQRRLFLQVLRSVESTSLGKKDLNVIVGSGTANAMALRSAGDICNVLEEVGRFSRAQLSQTSASAQILERAWRRRMRFQQDGVRITHVRVIRREAEDNEVPEKSDEREQKSGESSKGDKDVIDSTEDDTKIDEGLGDGFIRL